MIFDGQAKLIILETEIEISVQEIYSSWKRFVFQKPNFLPAFKVIGGDPLPGGRFLGTTFILIHDWKIRPSEKNHHLVIDGNLFTEDSSLVFVPTLGNYNVIVEMRVSNLIDTISTSGSSGMDDKNILTVGKFLALK